MTGIAWRHPSRTWMPRREHRGWRSSWHGLSLLLALAHALVALARRVGVKQSTARWLADFGYSQWHVRVPSSARLRIPMHHNLAAGEHDANGNANAIHRLAVFLGRCQRGLVQGELEARRLLPVECGA